MTKLHIYLFRHGQTSFNRDGRFTGWEKPKLTKLGIKQAKTVANKGKRSFADNYGCTNNPSCTQGKGEKAPSAPSSLKWGVVRSDFSV